MNTHIEPFTRGHLAILQEQADTATTGLLPNQLDLLEADPWTITLMVADKVILCGGVVRMWEGRGEAWAILSAERHQHRMAIFRAALMCLQLAQNTLRRIEANVVAGSVEAKRFVEHLGFHVEAFRPYYFPNGDHAAAYARLRNG